MKSVVTPYMCSVSKNCIEIMVSILLAILLTGWELNREGESLIGKRESLRTKYYAFPLCVVRENVNVPVWKQGW